MESAGLSLFFVGLVMHVMDTDIVLILMNALFIIPVISQFTKEFKSLQNEAEMELSPNLYQKRRKIHIQNVVLSSIAFFFQAGGIIGILYLVSYIFFSNLFSIEWETFRSCNWPIKTKLLDFFVALNSFYLTLATILLSHLRGKNRSIVSSIQI